MGRARGRPSGRIAVVLYNWDVSSLVPILLAVHVALALALVLPSIILPFALRGASAATTPGRLTGTLLRAQATGTVVIGAGLVLTGAGLLIALGGQLLAQPWLLVALAVYAANLVLAFFVQRPNLRRLIGARGGDGGVWRALARRQRYVSYAMAGLVGAVGFLMSTKPDLW